MNRWFTFSSVVLGLCFALAGCNPKIGDSCSADSDCSMQGDRVCDQSQPGGYCLKMDCDPDTCPGEAVCVEFLKDIRSERFCMRHCSSDGDCRGKYRCVDPDDVLAQIIDDKPKGDQFCIMDVPK